MGSTATPESLAGMQRLLELLHLAGTRVVAGTPLYLGVLLGLELLAEVRHVPGLAGFPYAQVIGYAKPRKIFTCENRATAARSCNVGYRAPARVEGEAKAPLDDIKPLKILGVGDTAGSLFRDSTPSRLNCPGSPAR
jgi:hypothetical protein